MRPEVIGQPASHIAALAGIEVPPATTVLIAPQTEVGWEAPLSPASSPRSSRSIGPRRSTPRSSPAAASTPTAGSATPRPSSPRTRPASGPSPSGSTPAGCWSTLRPPRALGGAYNALAPSLTLGVGTQGKTATTDNISARHLLNIERVARRRLSFYTCHDRVCMDESVGADDLDARCTRHQRSSCEAT